jgi:hypothetical protein
MVVGAQCRINWGQDKGWACLAYNIIIKMRVWGSGFSGCGSWIGFLFFGGDFGFENFEVI